MGINLLPQSERLLAREIELAKNLRRSTVAILSVYCAVVLAVAGYWFYWGGKLSGFEVRYETATVQLTELKDKEGKMTLIKSRLAELAGVVREGLSVSEMWRLVDSVVVGSVVIKDLAVTGKSVTFSGEADNSSDIKEFEQNIITFGEFTRVIMTNLSRSKGKYVFNFEVMMENETKN